MTVVLDASAVLALLLSEAGAAKVAGVLASSQMSAVNYAEVLRTTPSSDQAKPTSKTSLMPCRSKSSRSIQIWQRWLGC